MDWFSRTTQPDLSDVTRRRLLIGLAISLAVHAFILSLQLGLPGLGLPELSMPWEKRHAQTEDLQISLPQAKQPIQANSTPTVATNAPPEAAAGVSNNPVPVAVIQPLSGKRPDEPVHGLQLVTPPAPPVRPTPAATQGKPVQKTRSKPKNAAPVRAAPKKPAAMLASAPDIVAVDTLRDDNFVVAVRHPDELRHEEVKDGQTEAVPQPVAALNTEEKPEPDKVPDVVIAKAEQGSEKRAQQEGMLAQEARALLGKTTVPDTAALSGQLAKESRREADQTYRTQQALIAQQQKEEAEQAQRLAKQMAERELALLPAPSSRQEIAVAERSQEDEQKQKERLERLQRLQVLEREREQQRALSEQLRQAQPASQNSAMQEVLSQRLESSQVAVTKSERADAATSPTSSQAPVSSAAPAAAAVSARGADKNREAAAGDDPLAVADGGTRSANGNRNGSNARESGSGRNDLDALLNRSSGLNSDLASKARQQLREAGSVRLPENHLPLESRARRYSVFGGMERDIQIRMYVEGWKQKIERNGSLNYSHKSSEQARGDPVVTVMIRSDGSVEDIIIHRSSGRADIDQAVRNIVRLNARYAAFPPQIAAQYDVIEIRRIWSFDDNLRLLEELR